MDSNKASTSMPNSVIPECDSEKNINHKGTPRQVVQNDNEKVFTSTPNQGPNRVPLNGSHNRHSSAVSRESSSQSSKSSENSNENLRNIPSTSNSTSSKVDPECVAETATASTSRASLNTNNGGESSEGQPCHRHRVWMGPGCSNAPSTSSHADPDIVLKENRKRPSSLKLNRHNLDDDSSSDTGNDDYSLGSEDGCIYTYRGGEHLADLPSSFFSLDMGLPLDRHLPMPPNYPVQQGAGNREGGSRASSPDMDFLEMDFDPGPSCEVDTEDESTPDADLEADIIMPEENEPANVARGVSPAYIAPAQPSLVQSTPAQPTLAQPTLATSAGPQGDDVYSHAGPSTSQGSESQYDVPAEQPEHAWYGPYITHVNHRGEQQLVRRTMLHWAGPATYHPNGELMPQKQTTGYELTSCEAFFRKPVASGNEEPRNYPEEECAVVSLAPRLRLRAPTTDSGSTSAAYHLQMAKKLLADKTKEDESQSSNEAGDASEPGPSSSTSSVSCIEVNRCMIWSEREACERQVTQIAASACGATAVINVFNALGIPVNIERITQAVGTRARANTAPLPRYLLSRSVAGCTAADLVNGLQKASDGLVTARFFPTYPERAMSLSHWLADWISLGAVPILTLNLQNGCDGDNIPDAWHHQMVFGVSPRGVYLCNPIECVRETVLWPRLASPSTLLVRSRDIVSRYTGTTDLTPLMHVPDPRWHTYNVLGQVVNLIREWRSGAWLRQRSRTRHVRVPAAYCAGVTVAALAGTDAQRRLAAAHHAPLLHPLNEPA